MKKVLTTVAGIIAISVMGTACGPAVDKETSSTTPIAASSVVNRDNFKDEIREFKASRNATRPEATPRFSTHELHVNHVNHVAKTIKPKVEKKVLKPKAKTVKPKKVYKKTVKAKKIYHKKVYKTKKVTKKVTHKVQKAGKVSLAGIAACIAKYESGGNPRAQNPSSSASGLFQFVDGTWNNFGGYSRAMYAPVSVQLKKFYIVWNGGAGAGNWVVAPKCGY